MSLSDSACRNAHKSDKAKDGKAFKLFDEKGLFLLVKPTASGWGSKKVETWNEKNNRSKRMLERNIFPWLGGKPISEIYPKDILECLRRIEDRGTIETAHRTLQICGQVFRYAVATGRIDRDITQDLKGALPPAKGEHFAAITEPKEVAELLRAIDSYQGSTHRNHRPKLPIHLQHQPQSLDVAYRQKLTLPGNGSTATATAYCPFWMKTAASAKPVCTNYWTK